jgi:choline-sulfatase
VFTSDHGDMNGSHGLFDKGFPYEEAHRVPLLLRWPGRWPAQRRSELVSNMDILPTLLDLLGEPVDGLHGRSLAGLASRDDLVPLSGGDESVEWRKEFLLESHGMRHLYSQRALVTEDGLKYIFNPSHDDEMYDLRSDPGELVNLLQDERGSGRAAELRVRLLEALFEAGDPVREYAAKLFGDWSNRSGQPDASAPFGSGSGGATDSG